MAKKIKELKEIKEDEVLTFELLNEKILKLQKKVKELEAELKTKARRSNILFRG